MTSNFELEAYKPLQCSFLYRCAAGLVGWLLCLGCCRWANAQEGNSDGIEFFERSVRPILVEHCYACHSQESGEANGELRLDSKSAMTTGGTRGKVVDLSSPDQSLLLRAIDYHDSELQMPPEGKLAEPQIAVLRRWIEMGAPDPRDDTPPLLDSNTNKMEDRMAQAAKHWAYQPLQAPDTERTSSSIVPPRFESWGRDPIDRYVLVELDSRDLSPSSDADRRTLIRRLWFDLLGLPPTLEDISAWMACDSDDWYERMVRSLLASPHFGERMARRWMDVVRYADNKGYVFRENREYPHAYRYRDWLIRSFNSDLAYDDFIRYQLIGDRLDPDNAEGHLDAMGMLTLGRRFLQNKNDIIDDRIDVVCRGLLGVTVSCARCHDHKFDPVSAADYYSLHGMFQDSEEPGGEPSPMRLVDKESQSKTFIFLRGNPGNRGPAVERAFFGAFTPDSRRLMSQGSGRLDLTEGIVSPQNPLTARVYVNRIWGWLTGRPIVDSPSDFGLRCERPIYHAILDDLAWDFVQQGWSTKKLIERIVLSSTYRQSSRSNPRMAEVDPENRLLWRSNRRRLDFESHRDALLKAAGSLDPTIGGKSVVIDKSPYSPRRTLYAYIDRQNLPQIFRSFDFGSPDVHVPQRPQTTVPQQSLVLMNSPMIHDLLRPLVQQFSIPRPKDDSRTDEDRLLLGQVEQLFQQLLARDPSDIERQQFVEFMKHCDTTLVSSPQNCWMYGWGHFDEKSRCLLSFERLPRFENERWTCNADSLDSPGSSVWLRDSRMNPGASTASACVRRWTAPRTGKLSISGGLEHASDVGDGIRASILVNRERCAASWILKAEKTSTAVSSIEVTAGDTVDFVVDCLGDANQDECGWTVVLKYEDSSEKFDSKEHFSGMQPTPASPLQQAAQVLLLANEFCFVD